MDIKQLIKELEKYPSDTDIYVSVDEISYCKTLKKVEEDQVDGEIVLIG